jgi:hypothetical protein
MWHFKIDTTPFEMDVSARKRCALWMQGPKNWGGMARDLNSKAGLTGVETTLYRPIGETEMELIGESGWHAFPPRLPEQPFFYSVLNEGYRNQIARDWNTRDGGIGYVTRFQVDSEYLQQFPVHTAGLEFITSIGSPPRSLRNSTGTLSG